MQRRRKRKGLSPIARMCLKRREGKTLFNGLSITGCAIDRAKILNQEEQHPGYIDSLIKMFDDMIGDV